MAITEVDLKRKRLGLEQGKEAISTTVLEKMMLKREKIVPYVWESFTHNNRRYIISRSARAMIDPKHGKWKIIAQTNGKPGIFGGFKTKAKAKKALKRRITKW